MKSYITVYELIQNLSKFPADTYVEIWMWTTHEQIPKYEKEWETDDYVRFDAEEIDYKFGLGFNQSKTAVIIELDAERKEEWQR